MEQQNIPYFAHEGMMARMERTIKRLWVLCIILIILLAGSNGAWVWYESQFEDEQTTVTQELNSDGGDAIINDGKHADAKPAASPAIENATCVMERGGSRISERFIQSRY